MAPAGQGAATDSPNSGRALDVLENLLRRQARMAQNDDFDGVAQLLSQVRQPLDAAIAQARPSDADQLQRIERLHSSILLGLSLRRKEMAKELIRMHQGKQTLRGYGGRL